MLKHSNIEDIEFSKLYKKQKKYSSFKAKTAQDWDNKAKYMNERVFKSIYIKEFLDHVDTKGAKTLLDVGSGPGTLGLSLAKKMKKVYCLDFSLKMLKLVTQNAKKMGLCNVETLHQSLEGDWKSVPKCDILIASRCLEVKDVKATLKLFNKHAKKVYLTYRVGGSFVDEDILKGVDEDIIPKPDFIYIINILYEMGIMPNLTYIHSENSRFNAKSFEEFLQKIKWSVGNFSGYNEVYLRKLYEKKYSKKSSKNGCIKWAMISYEL